MTNEKEYLELKKWKNYFLLIIAILLLINWGQVYLYHKSEKQREFFFEELKYLIEDYNELISKKIELERELKECTATRVELRTYDCSQEETNLTVTSWEGGK